MSLCDRCEVPGTCCQNITLSGGAVLLIGTTKLEALTWVASVEPSLGELGLPFLPVAIGNQGYNNGPGCPQWSWSCPNLDEDTGRCLDYDNRPNLCRSFIPGYHKPCAMLGRNSAPCDLIFKTYPRPDTMPKDTQCQT